MKIKEMLSQYRNDFTAMIECEHCGNLEKLTSGYHDGYYHTKVIPAMHCNTCGKNRAGALRESDMRESHMARNDIIRLAQEAGIHYSFGMELERFAALVAEAEREACALVCEPQSKWDDPLTAYNIANAIRARRKS